MHNEYDNERFFMEYAKMARSRDGLRSAGEWRQLKPLFPPLQGARVLDLGCGYGWHCRFAAERGAVRVLGLDLSSKMIAEAKKRSGERQVEYRVCGIEEYEYPENAWDCVVSNLALHYVENIETIFRNAGSISSGSSPYSGCCCPSPRRAVPSEHCFRRRRTSLRLWSPTRRKSLDHPRRAKPMEPRSRRGLPKLWGNRRPPDSPCRSQRRFWSCSGWL